MIRVLLAEDSPVQRELLSYVIRKTGEFEIVASVHDGQEAVEEAERLGPDLILMDCQMPKLDGIAATKAIMERKPTPIVVMTGSYVGDAVKFSFEAIGSGALAVVAKPTAVGSAANERAVEHLVETMRLMSAVKVVRRWRERMPDGETAHGGEAPGHRTRARLVAIAGSTGAPAVVAEILNAVAGKLDAPILIVQHISEGFVGGFALWLQHRSGIAVEVARDGVQARAGCAYVAPDDAHLEIDEKSCLVLKRDPPLNGFRPSATALFQSVARSFGPAALGVLLSGMGRDGAEGLLSMHQRGAVTAVQNEESCVVFGMPQEALRIGAADSALEPAAIAKLIVDATRAAS